MMKEEEKKYPTAPWNDPDVRWVCEDHPTEEQGHRIGWWIFSKECGGAGMPEPTEENRRKDLKG